jgi:hypothetical protein
VASSRKLKQRRLGCGQELYQGRANPALKRDYKDAFELD